MTLEKSGVCREISTYSQNVHIFFTVAEPLGSPLLARTMTAGTHKRMHVKQKSRNEFRFPMNES